MPIINSYPQDIDIQDQDAWIGTDYNTKSTKQYTAEAVANYLNQKGRVSIAGQVSYKFVDTLFAGQGTMALSPNNGSSFSAITGFKIAKADLSGQGIQEYLDYLIGREIIIVNQNEPNSFGHYSIYTYTVDGDNDQYYDLVVTFIGGNGSISVNSFYSIANFTFGGENATKASLTNIGIGNVNPSTYPTLKGLTVSYNNGTATIGLNIQDLPNTAIPASASDILVPWAAEVSGVTYNSKATLQDLIDDTGVVGGPYLPLAGGTMTGNITLGTGSYDGKIFNGYGSSSSPSYSFRNDTDTGIYSPNPNTLSFSTNSAERLRITSSGNVGIGTTNPDYKLDVNGDGYFNGQIRIKSPGVGNSISIIESTSGNLAAYMGESAVGHGFLTLFEKSVGEVIKFDANGNSFINRGNVGIGTSNPQRELHVHATNYTDIQLTNDTTGTGAGDGSTISATGNDLYINNKESGSLLLYTNNSEKVRVISDGNVGIGTTSPGEKLEVAGQYGNTTLSGHVVGFTRASANYLWAKTSGGDLRFTVNGNAIGSPSMTLSTAGNLGIGTTSPSSKLEVEGDIHPASNVSYSLGSSTKSFLFTNTYAVSSAGDLQMLAGGSEKMRITSAGNVGIGTTSPTERLDVSGNIKLKNTINYIKFANDLVTIKRDGSNFLSLNGFAGFKFYDTQNSSERMRINGSGNVGIGTTSPGSKLEVNGTININNSGDRVFIADPGQGTFSLGDLDALSSEAQIVGTGVDLLFKNDDTTTMVATYNNRVGIGTTSPASKLEVDGGDIEIDDSASGLILRSPDGTRYRVTVANGGTLTVTAV